MSAVRNVAREKLEQGQLALGVGIRMTRSVEIAKAMAVAKTVFGESHPYVQALFCEINRHRGVSLRSEKRASPRRHDAPKPAARGFDSAQGS